MNTRSAALVLSWGMFSLAPLSSTYLPEQVLPLYGGSGGHKFERACPSGSVLTGLTFRAGLLVDAVGVLCKTVNSSTGALGSQTSVGSQAGGGGGTSGSVSCGTGRVVTGFNLRHGTYVNSLQLLCKAWDPATKRWGGSVAGTVPQMVGSTLGGGTFNGAVCSDRTQPARIIYGRARDLVDAFSLICDEPFDPVPLTR